MHDLLLLQARPSAADIYPNSHALNILPKYRLNAILTDPSRISKYTFPTGFFNETV